MTDTAAARDEAAEIRDGMRIEWDVEIVAGDGTPLRADVFRPVEGGPFPVLLSYGPYAKGLAFQEGYPDQWRIMAEKHPDVTAGSTNAYQNWEVVDPEKWVPDGYAIVRVDSRGAGRSPGHLDPFCPREAQDLYDCIEWAGTRPWSNGKVGLAGISYYAINQWAAAALQPPHLAAMCPWEGAADWYRDMSHHGGILCTFLTNWFDKQVAIVQHGLGERGFRSPITGEPVAGPETLSDEELARNRAPFGEEILDHPFDDDYHRGRSPDWSMVRTPLLSAGNWGGHGLHLRGNVEGFVRAASEHKWLEIHGLEHWTEFYTDYGVELQKRFFASFLKDDDSGWRDQPPVQLQVRRHDGFVQRGEQEWPLARTRWTKMHLDPVDRTLAEQPPASEGSVSYEALGDGVTFMGPPLEHDLEITGPVAARLSVSSSTQDADLFLVLRAFDPDGRELTFQGALDPHTPIAQGWLRLSHRALDDDLSEEYRPYHRHDRPEPVTPGEVLEVDVEIWPTSVVLPPGYRLALTVRGTDYVYDGPGDAGRLGSFKNELTGCGPFLHDDPTDRPADTFGGTQTLHTGGGRAAYVLLPIIPTEESGP